MSESWGKEFSRDYRKFIAVYGSGTIQDYLAIQEPEPKGGPPKSAFGGILHEMANAEHAWATNRKSPELVGTNPELIAWGGGLQRGHAFHWMAAERAMDVGFEDFTVSESADPSCPRGHGAVPPWGVVTLIHQRPHPYGRERGRQ